MRTITLPKAARRGSVLTTVVLGFSLVGPPCAQGNHISVQEAVLRAKPTVALIVSEVSADVQVDCNGDRTRVAPTPFRETGTGWVIDARGYLITNGHVVQPAYTPPMWLISSLTRKGVESACVPIMLARMGVQPGDRPDLEEQLKRRAFDTALPTATAKLHPNLSPPSPNHTPL